MTAEIIDGRALAARIRQGLKTARQGLGDRCVRLVSLELGESAAAAAYLRNQRRVATELGIELDWRNLPETCSEAELIGLIGQLNEDPEVTGVIIQRPLPEAIDPRPVQHAVHPRKDVEGMSPANMGAILYREPKLPPCTAAAALELIRETAIDLHGAETVVVGHSEIVGKPIAILLLHHLATVTVCHIGTRNLAEHTRGADILVVAVGKAGLIRREMIKPGAIVIDAGINYSDGKLVGDVDFTNVAAVAGKITPVPGGVGPVTTAMLMRNTLRAAGAVGI